MFSNRIGSSVLSFAALSLFLTVADWRATGASGGDEVVRGPVWSGTVRGKGRDATVAMKGLAITLSSAEKAFVCYDSDLMRPSLAWTGDFLDFGNTLTKIEWPPPPQVKGTAVFSTKEAPGFSMNDDYGDPRPKHQGPLSKDAAHYSGLYVDGDKVVLRYTVGTTEVHELPGYEQASGLKLFTRTLRLRGGKAPLSIAVAKLGNEIAAASDLKVTQEGDSQFILTGTAPCLAIGVTGASGRAIVDSDHQLWVKFSKLSQETRLKLVLSMVSSDSDIEAFRALLRKSGKVEDVMLHCKGGPAHWSAPVETKGTLGLGDGPYLVDNLTEPVPNPWNARTFFGGFDFFPDGRAAICTFHGDVWIVSGLDENLNRLSWKRVATGLFQPLGLKVVKNQIYVLGRDQITRLHDLNKDGEMDYYENFNNDTVVTANYHEFCLDLHTDSQGNFFFAKGAPWTPDVTSPHQGTLIKVSKDGRRMEIYATGFRAPNGSSIGPRDEVTVSDNQGHWMPSSKVNWVKKGGFYGMTPSAQRSLRLTRDGTNFVANPSDAESLKTFRYKAWDKGAPQPEDYDRPLSWLPMSMDNSSGGQAWVTSSKWGPFQNDMLFMSYGRCTLFHVMHEEIGGVRQGGMVQFPLKFQSGIMRGRFNPKDGQLYLCGLKGWQTSATREGGFYRVRYNGKPVRMPQTLHVARNGVEIRFTCPLDEVAAKDLGSYGVEQWNYQWTGNYGSPEFSVLNPSEKKHDSVDVKSVRLSSDKKSVFLDLGEVRPCDQMKIKFNLKSADGTTFAQEIYNTIYKTGPAK